VDKIVVIDGSFTKDMPSEISTDETKNIVQRYSDFDDKTFFISGGAESQVDQRNKILDQLDDMDWLFIVDDDEIFHPEHLEFMRGYLSVSKENSFRMTGYNFVNSFDWYYVVHNMRLFRVKEGMNYHGPNSMQLNNDKTFYATAKSPVIPEVIRYHYSYVRKPERLEIKQKQAMEFQNKFPWIKDGQFVTRDGVEFKRFDGKHPKILKDHPCSKIHWEPK
jgi:glycosyltransferase involved in cell wall biosynthesis